MCGGKNNLNVWPYNTFRPNNTFWPNNTFLGRDTVKRVRDEEKIKQGEKTPEKNPRDNPMNKYDQTRLRYVSYFIHNPR